MVSPEDTTHTLYGESVGYPTFYGESAGHHTPLMVVVGYPSFCGEFVGHYISYDEYLAPHIIWWVSET